MQPTTEQMNKARLIEVTEKGLANVQKAIKNNKFKQTYLMYYKKGVDGQKCEVCFLGAVAINLNIMQVRGDRLIDKENRSIPYNEVLIRAGIPQEVCYAYSEFDQSGSRSLGAMVVYLNDDKKYKMRTIFYIIRRIVRKYVNDLPEDWSAFITYYK